MVTQALGEADLLRVNICLHCCVRHSLRAVRCPDMLSEADMLSRVSFRLLRVGVEITGMAPFIFQC